MRTDPRAACANADDRKSLYDITGSITDINTMLVPLSELRALMLPAAYVSSTLTGSPTKGANVNFHFSDAAEAEAWHEAVTALADPPRTNRVPNEP